MILDFDLDFLEEAARFFDSQLERLHREAQATPDPDGLGVFDRMEYVTGLGFVACQQYLDAIRKTAPKGAALECGPHHRTGPPMAAVVNAAANHWKHAAEATNPPSSNEMKRLAVLRTVGVEAEWPYALTNTLHALLTPLPCRFERLLPFLVEWRDNVRTMKAI